MDSVDSGNGSVDSSVTGESRSGLSSELSSKFGSASGSGLENSGAPERVVATAAALALIEQLRKRHGPLMFFQSGGCCDGSAPMCYPAGEFSVSDTDVRLGTLDGAPFYMGAEQFAYWEHTQLIIDVVAGNGGMFSLDNGTGQRFLTRSRLFSDAELQQLPAPATGA